MGSAKVERVSRRGAEALRGAPARGALAGVLLDVLAVREAVTWGESSSVVFF
jgi:hypothetical protein